MRGKHDFGRSIKSSDDVLCQIFFFLFAQIAGKAEITIFRKDEKLIFLPDFEVAVLVQQDVWGLQVAVDEVGGVDELECAEDLI